MSQPEGDRGDGQHREVVDSSLLVAGGDATKLLQTVDQPFDDVPPPVRVLVEADASLPLLPSNHHPNAPAPQVPPDLLAAVALVSSDSVRPHALPSPPR